MNKLTKKVLICCAVLLAAAAAILLIAVGSPDTDADSYLQYAGSILGGFATMTAVVVALLDRGQDRAIENKPRISLVLRDQSAPAETGFVFFRRKGSQASDELKALPLVLENRGSTEVRIKGIFVGAEMIGADESDPGIWMPYRSYSLRPGEKWSTVSDSIDIGASLALPVSVSEKRYSPDGAEKVSQAKTNRFLIDIYFNNEFYGSGLFLKRYQIDQPLRSTVEWWRNADIRSMGTEEVKKTMEQVEQEKAQAGFTVRVKE